MVSRFDELTISPGMRVDPLTWEILEEFDDSYSIWSVRPWSYMPPKYSQQAIDTARSTTSILCEEVLAKVTNWKRVRRWNNRGHDIILPDDWRLEAKVWRIWNAAVIKENQLFEFDATFWGFMFYRTFTNMPPSFYTSQEKWISPSTYLLRNIDIVSVFIFSSEVMRYYWNSTPVKKWIISTSWISHKPFAISRAHSLFEDTDVPGERATYEFSHGRHSFDVKSIDLEL